MLTGDQIISILREQGAGVATAEVWGENAISSAALYASNPGLTGVLDRVQ